MHKKHYEALAGAIAKHSNDTSIINFHALCVDVSQALKLTSRDYQEAKFLTACGISNEPLPDLSQVKTWKYYKTRASKP